MNVADFRMGKSGTGLAGVLLQVFLKGAEQDSLLLAGNDRDL